MGVRDAVQQATSSSHQELDVAAVELALTYATDIDAGISGADLAKVGTALLAALESLGLTPRSRAALLAKGAAPDDDVSDPLDELRAKRAARFDNAAAVDTAP